MILFEFNFANVHSSLSILTDRKISIGELEEKTGLHRNVISRALSGDNITGNKIADLFSVFVDIASKECNLELEKAISLINKLMIQPRVIDDRKEKLNNLLNSL